MSKNCQRLRADCNLKLWGEDTMPAYEDHYIKIGEIQTSEECICKIGTNRFVAKICIFAYCDESTYRNLR